MHNAIDFAPVQPTEQDIQTVATRLEMTYHAVTALHGLCNAVITRESVDPVTQCVVMREVLRSIARDMENCTEILDGTPGSLGYFEASYGKI